MIVKQVISWGLWHWKKLSTVLQPLVLQCNLMGKSIFGPQCITWRCSYTVRLLRKLASKSITHIINQLNQRYSNGASGPPVTYLWPPNCYFFTMCFGWVSLCISGLVSMLTMTPPAPSWLRARSNFSEFRTDEPCSARRGFYSCYKQVRQQNKKHSYKRGTTTSGELTYLFILHCFLLL